MVVAPLDANTMAKIANGLCDNLLVSDRAWASCLFQASFLFFSDLHLASLGCTKARCRLPSHEYEHVGPHIHG